MNYNELLDFDTSYLPLDFWEYNPAWDVQPEELEEALDIEDEVWYNEGSEKGNDRSYE
jgi:hypothetical protein